MKNVLLVDCTIGLYNSLSKIPDVKLVGLCVKSDIQKNNILSTNGDINIFTPVDIVNWNETFVSKSDIHKYYGTQLKFEKYCARMNDSAVEIIDLYYKSLAFWLNIYDTYDIDIVIVGQIEHGSPDDSIPIDIAKSKLIPVFTIEILYSPNKSSLYYGIKCHNTSTYINLNKLNYQRKIPQLTEILNIRNDECNNITTIKYIFQLLHEKSYLNAYRLYIILMAIIGKKTYTSSQGVPWIFSYRECIKSVIYMNRLKRYYQRRADKEIISGGKYFIYAMHFEPEASIMNRSTYNSQLYNISMISKYLPDGYILYVKEHPNQFNLFNPESIGFTKHIHIYRSRNYYDKILKNSNVRLLNINISSKELMKKYNENNGLKGIITINGTIATECMYNEIPTIVFESKSSAYNELSTYYDVDNAQDLVYAINNIINNIEVKPEMNINSICNYLFKVDAASLSYDLDDMKGILAQLIKTSDSYLDKNL